MRSAFARRATRLRGNSLSTATPPTDSSDYLREYESIAASILYQSPLPSRSGLPLFVLNSAAFPDSDEIDYDALFPYVLARLPDEEELIAGVEYEVVFFAGGPPETATGGKKTGAGRAWYLQAYHALSRPTRKRLQKLYIVHERSWVRVLIEVFGAIVSPKFKRKVVHVNNLNSLAQHLQIEKLLIPPSAYLFDRRISKEIYVPSLSGRRAFSANEPLPRNYNGERRLPRVLRETTSFLCQGDNLKQEGIFRIPQHATYGGILREAYDRGQRFVVWKEFGTQYTEPAMDRKAVAEIHPGDAYGIHLATGLIKTWYRELKQPIFPESSYQHLRDTFGSRDTEIHIEDLQSLISPASDTSVISYIDRLILTWHLLPLLELTASYQEVNKMSPDNLAICFAPALVCGSNQLEDAKMTSVIRRILESAIQHWSDGLATVCGIEDDQFRNAIRPPKNDHDYEDPYYEVFDSVNTNDEHAGQRIMMKQDDEEEAANEKPPALPPRISSLPNRPLQNIGMKAAAPKRKPVIPRHDDGVAPHVYDTVEDHSLPSEAGLIPSQFKTIGSWTGNEDVSVEQQSPIDLLSDSPTDTTITSSSKPGQPSIHDIVSQGNKLRSTSGESTTFSDDGFVKPTWAASSRQVSGSSISSTTTQQQRLIAPSQLNLPNKVNSQYQPDRSDSIGASGFQPPKPRTPSPALLERMNSMERAQDISTIDGSGMSNNGGGGGQSGGIGRPVTAGMRQQSVDDLRRIYEERAGTAAALETFSSTNSSASSATTGRR